MYILPVTICLNITSEGKEEEEYLMEVFHAEENRC